MVRTAVRRALLPPIHAFKERLFGGFALSHTTEDEYALTILCEEPRLEALLDEMGFSRSFVSALKLRLDGNVEDGSWVSRESMMAEKQLHVVTHEREDAEGIDVYAHEECSKLRHPLKHYRKVAYDADAGVHRFRNMIDRYEQAAVRVPRYEVRPPRERTWAWFLHLISFISTPMARRLGGVMEFWEARMFSPFDEDDSN